ncbi:hypothetical protein SNEBB_008153 [Seison nebaliae]|nr:hypothetical protein SNEBB_008153 [Seison nebaliae]
MNLQSGKSRKLKKFNASCYLQFKRCADGRPVNTNPIYPINPLLPQQQQQRLPLVIYQSTYQDKSIELHRIRRADIIQRIS